MSDPVAQLSRLGAAPPVAPEPLEALQSRGRRRHRRRRLVAATSLGLIVVAGLLVVVPDEDRGRVRTVDEPTPSASIPGTCRDGSLSADVDGDGQQDQIDHRPDAVVGTVVLVCLASGREVTAPGVAFDQRFVALDVEPDGRFEILALFDGSTGGTLYTFSDGQLTRFSLVDDDFPLSEGATEFDASGSPSEASAYGCEDLSGDGTREIVQVRAAFTATGASWIKTAYSLSGTFATQVFFDEGVADLPVDRLAYASSLTSSCFTTDRPMRGAASCAVLDGAEPSVGGFALTTIPPGFTPDGGVEETSTGTGFVDMGGEVHATLRFSDSSGRWIEFDSFGMESPGAFVQELHAGAVTERVTYPRCVNPTDAQPSEYQADLSNHPDRTILAAQEWEYGGFSVTGGPGVTVEELITVASGLANAPPAA